MRLATLHSESMSHQDPNLICDGCGQIASPRHLAARFRRLEWATRWRPLHIHTLLLGTVAPEKDTDFVYSDAGDFGGVAACILRVAGVATAGKPADAVHHELQRVGIFVAHVLECPLEDTVGTDEALAQLLAERAGGTLTRIRRSIKPKRTALIGPGFDSVLAKFTPEALGCDVILDGGRAFKLDESVESIEHLRGALERSAAATR
jgi:hypothetical protein